MMKFISKFLIFLNIDKNSFIISFLFFSFQIWQSYTIIEKYYTNSLAFFLSFLSYRVKLEFSKSNLHKTRFSFLPFIRFFFSFVSQRRFERTSRAVNVIFGNAKWKTDLNFKHTRHRRCTKQKMIPFWRRWFVSPFVVYAAFETS